MQSSILNRFLYSAIALVTTFSSFGQSNYPLKTSTQTTFSYLKDGFKNPPPESRLRCYWWWLNSMATKESITRDLEQMKAKGYGGASIVDAGSSNYQVAHKTAKGPTFMSPEWMELYQHAVREADRLGIELSVNIQSGWNPGAPSITPEFAMKKIVFTTLNVKGGTKLSIKLPQPEVKLYYKDICVQAIPLIPNVRTGNAAIENWKKKTFNEKIGWKGVYPLWELRHDFADDGSDKAVKKDQIIDLTSNFKDSILTWNAPEGDYTIIRYGYTCTGARTSTSSDGWEGLSVDHLSPQAFELFNQTVITPLIKTAQAAGKSVHYLQTDSWEMDLVSWTANFPSEFRKFRGYDIFPYLPSLAGYMVENRDQTNRFLHDFRQTVGDCVAENHYRLFYNVAHQYGLGIHPESGGPHSAPVDAIRVMGISDFPQGEFWAVANTHRIKDDERLSVRQSASVAHVYGKRFVAAEGPTSIGPQWERSPRDLKGNLDRIFCSGVNRIVWHTFTSSPKEFGKPGNEYFAGTHLNPNTTWWEWAGDFIGYLDRTSFLLQQGLFVADVLEYYGDDVPNFVFLKEDMSDLKFGYDWDKCSKEVVLNRLSFENGRIVLPDGMNYRVMRIGEESEIDLDVLKKLEQLVLKGMVLVGKKPLKCSGLSHFPDGDPELKNIADRMWGKIDGKQVTQNNYGKGKVIWGPKINEILAQLSIHPDFAFTSGSQETALDYIHRHTDQQEIYYVTNRFLRKGINDFEFRYLTTLPDRYEQTECTFRVSGMKPYLWNPLTGEQTEILVYREKDGRITLPLHLNPEGGQFVVFNKENQSNQIVNIQHGDKVIFPNGLLSAMTNCKVDVFRDGDKVCLLSGEPGKYQIQWNTGKVNTIEIKKAPKPIVLAKGWSLFFDPGLKGPRQMKTDTLKSWTAFSNPDVKYYSGKGKYTNSFTVTQEQINGNQITLDLGNVHEMAAIRINGKAFPSVWCAPYRYDITKYVKVGNNDLEIEVINMWPNRLIGDAGLPEGQRITKTNVVKFNGTDRETYLRDSGLIGPVEIRFLPIYTFTK